MRERDAVEVPYPVSIIEDGLQLDPSDRSRFPSPFPFRPFSFPSSFLFPHNDLDLSLLPTPNKTQQANRSNMDIRLPVTIFSQLRSTRLSSLLGPCRHSAPD